MPHTENTTLFFSLVTAPYVKLLKDVPLWLGISGVQQLLTSMNPCSGHSERRSMNIIVVVSRSQPIGKAFALSL